MKLPVLFASAALAACALAAPSAAAPLQFSWDEPSSVSGAPDLTLTFQLDSDPAPIGALGDTFSAQISGATLNGAPDPGLTLVSFADKTGQGGFVAGDLATAGDQIFTGGTGGSSRSGAQPAPHFSSGTFDLFDFSTGGTGVLTVSDVSSAPEPAAWVLMLAGVAVTGAALRRRGAPQPA